MKKYINKKTILVFVVLLVVILLISLFTSTNNNQESIDTGGDPSSGVYDVDGALVKTVTSKEYSAIQRRLQEFVYEKYGENQFIIEVSNPYTPEREGLVLTFDMTIKDVNIDKEQVKIDYTTETLEISSQNYSTLLYPDLD